MRGIRLSPRTYAVGFAGVGGVSAVYLQSRLKHDSEPHHLNTSTFLPYTLVAKDAVSSTSSIFTLRPQSEDARNSKIMRAASESGIWSVQFKQPQLQIARNYTPLPVIDEERNNELQVLIRREKGGEVSNYLHDLPDQATIAIRGPFQEVSIPQDVTNVIFLAGGTGIAPALQVAQVVRERKDLNLHIMWANRKREDCAGGRGAKSSENTGMWDWFRRTREMPVPALEQKGRTVQLLEDLRRQAEPGRLHVDYFVDEEGTSVKPSMVSKLLLTPGKGTSIILISGPDGFVEYWAGKKDPLVGNKMQNRLGGQLAKMNTKEWTVIRI